MNTIISGILALNKSNLLTIVSFSGKMWNFYLYI